MMPMQGMGMPMMGNMGGMGGCPMMMLPNGQLVSIPMGGQNPGGQGTQGGSGQGASGQQPGVFMMPMMGQQPGQQQGNQQGSSSSTSATGQPNMQALQAMMGGNMPMGGMIVQGPQGANGMQGIMLPPNMMGGQGQMGMFGQSQNSNQSTNSGSGSTQLPFNMSAFSGANGGSGFMMPNLQGQNQGQKPANPLSTSNP